MLVPLIFLLFTRLLAIQLEGETDQLEEYCDMQPMNGLIRIINPSTECYDLIRHVSSTEFIQFYIDERESLEIFESYCEFNCQFIHRVALSDLDMPIHSVLYSLSSLKTLSFSGGAFAMNQLEMASMNHLGQFGVYGRVITMSHLNLPQLEELDLSLVDMKDELPWYGTPNLRRLSLPFCNLESLDFLTQSNLLHLRELDIKYNNVAGLEPLTIFNELQVVDARNNIELNVMEAERLCILFGRPIDVIVDVTRPRLMRQ